MSFDFSLTPRVEEWRGRIAEFVGGVVIPREQEAFTNGLDDDLRRELQEAAKGAGIWAPQAPADLGGGGFRFDEAAVLLEEAGTSLLGPLALGCAAPDEGNIHLLNMVATPAQREKYLLPLVNGDVRSCFAMTEPPPGAGSDPSAVRTLATKAPGGWTISGEKHLITGAEGAAFSIVMARDDESGGATMLMVDTDTPGFVVKEHARTIDSTMVGGHCRVLFEDVFVPDDAVLGEPGLGFRYVQVRLAPARLTHCMRWLGAARRAHEIALGRAVDRELFGQRMTDLGMAQQLIADNEIDLVAARALLWQSCWELAGGDKGNESSSRAKVFVSEAVGRIVDRSVQLAGGMGTSEDLVIGRVYADIRAFRIYDGASEAHRMSIAKRTARRARTAADKGNEVR
ncbi:acyl-CoA dehydrogenase family protein [Actinacidiphila oryziradicis]|uniref:Acyl-CoA dehydrogenase family protein n=1 Tax=Actinacidiphila oryziradicis TaxID=2571141 RepID=A0A4U0S7Y0_9ACTN|nr:acyl-CoA dehydrogenase family protein [Actinacidiphila oryziradicis]TKA04623.1 acyl-CoA dehydrogenase family protein [Actinacidiphila oryziradicis]